MRVRFYLDEDVPAQLAKALRQRRIDILTTQEARMAESTDQQQAAFAVERQRAILTHNKRDFINIHRTYIESGKEHWGIIVADQNKVGPLLRLV